MADQQVQGGAQSGEVVSRGNGELDRDLGFGSVVSRRHNYRLLNRDGSFNVRVLHGPVLDRFVSYHRLLTLPWSVFFALIALGYVMLNAAFAGL